MANSTGKLEQWRLRMSELEFDIARRANNTHQAAVPLSRLNTKGEDMTTIDDEVPVLTVFYKVLACAPQTVIIDFDVIDEPKYTFIPYIPEVCMTTGITDKGKMEIQTLAERISAQSTGAVCRSAFSSVGTPSARFNVDSDG